MREIKFRAWYTKFNAMWNVWLMQYTNSVTNKETGERAEINEVELMQYTGLKDKNDVEIYEGDIVKHITAKWTGEIKYTDGSFVVEGQILTWYLNKGRAERLEVIGNIHDNPELLEGNQ